MRTRFNQTVPDVVRSIAIYLDPDSINNYAALDPAWGNATIHHRGFVEGYYRLASSDPQWDPRALAAHSVLAAQTLATFPPLDLKAVVALDLDLLIGRPVQPTIKQERAELLDCIFQAAQLPRLTCLERLLTYTDHEFVNYDTYIPLAVCHRPFNPLALALVGKQHGSLAVTMDQINQLWVDTPIFISSGYWSYKNGLAYNLAQRCLAAGKSLHYAQLVTADPALCIGALDYTSWALPSQTAVPHHPAFQTLAVDSHRTRTETTILTVPLTAAAILPPLVYTIDSIREWVRFGNPQTIPAIVELIATNSRPYWDGYGDMLGSCATEGQFLRLTALLRRCGGRLPMATVFALINRGNHRGINWSEMAILCLLREELPWLRQLTLDRIQTLPARPGHPAAIAYRLPDASTILLSPNNHSLLCLLTIPGQLAMVTPATSNGQTLCTAEPLAEMNNGCLTLHPAGTTLALPRGLGKTFVLTVSNVVGDLQTWWQAIQAALITRHGRVIERLNE